MNTKGFFTLNCAISSLLYQFHVSEVSLHQDNEKKMKPVGNSGDQTSVQSVTRVLLVYYQRPVACCSISAFSPIISWFSFHWKSWGKTLAHLLMQWPHTSFPGTNMESGLAGRRKRSRVLPLTVASCPGKSTTTEPAGSNIPIYSGENNHL